MGRVFVRRGHYYKSTPQKNHCSSSGSTEEQLQLNFDLEKQQLIIEQQTQEITYLKEIIALMKREAV